MESLNTISQTLPGSSTGYQMEFTMFIEDSMTAGQVVALSCAENGSVGGQGARNSSIVATSGTSITP